MSERGEGRRGEDEGAGGAEQALHLHQDPRGSHQGLLQGGEGEEPDTGRSGLPATGTGNR